jgi:hypothetical protein
LVVKWDSSWVVEYILEVERVVLKYAILPQVISELVEKLNSVISWVRHYYKISVRGNVHIPRIAELAIPMPSGSEIWNILPIHREEDNTVIVFVDDNETSVHMITNHTSRAVERIRSRGLLVSSTEQRAIALRMQSDYFVLVPVSEEYLFEE